MDKNRQKEQFNIAYVHALASQAGLNPARSEVDDDSVDLYLMGKGYSAPVRNPQIQLQLKCTSRNLIQNNVLKFPLKRKNYDDLRERNLICPRYLVVLVVPSDHNHWIQHNEHNMILSHACYWTSIIDHPETTQTSVTIDIPTIQKLTAEELSKLMLLASLGST